MKRGRSPASGLLALVIALGAAPAPAQENVPGAFVETLLSLARDTNPEYASMRLEAQAASERIEPAGALPDPKLRAELMDITKADSQAPALWPNDAGSTRYTLMQDLPWFGKRDLRRQIAAAEADGAQGRAKGGWAELAAKVKTTHALRYYHHRNQELSREVLDLMGQLEKIAQLRYAGGLNAQQDVIRAQIEQTNMRGELLALDAEGRQMDARLNALLARPSTAPLAAPKRLRSLPAPEQLDPQALQARVQAASPLLGAQQSRIQAAEKTRDLTFKNRYPDFSVGLALTQYADSGTAAPSGNAPHGAAAMAPPPPPLGNEWAVMVEFNIPLQRGSRRAQEREAEAMLAAARAQKEASANQLLADLEENLAMLEAARQSGQLASTSLLPQAELTFQAALAGYENGKVDFATLLDAQRQIRQAKQNQLKAQFEAQARLAEIEKLLGEDL